MVMEYKKDSTGNFSKQQDQALNSQMLDLFERNKVKSDFVLIIIRL